MFLPNLISKFNLPSIVMKTRNFPKLPFVSISSNENLKPGSNYFMNIIGNELINKDFIIYEGEIC